MFPAGLIETWRYWERSLFAAVVCVLRTQETMTGSGMFAICARRAQATMQETMTGS